MLFLCKRLDSVYGEDLNLQHLQTFMSQVLTKTDSLYKSKEKTVGFSFVWPVFCLLVWFFSCKVYLNTRLFLKCIFKTEVWAKEAREHRQLSCTKFFNQ